MNKKRQDRYPIGYVGETDREVVGYTDHRSVIYKVKCNRCNSVIAGTSKTLRVPCKKCSYEKKKPLQDLRYQIFWKYRYNANLKGVPFEISFEDFKKTISQDCFYCGVAPSRKWVSKRKAENTIIYNGIDRLINEKGYVKNNYVTCCSTCNYIKKDYSIKEFKKIVKKWSERLDTW
jgi:hypothetical protein